jgi:preprotein translocase subunit SecE
MVKKPTTTSTPIVQGARKGGDITKLGAKPDTTKSAEGSVPKKRTSPAKFIQEVRQEAKKITWTTRKETWITTVMVLIMVLLACIFFYIVDGILGFSVNYLINIGR